jgi:hypothetical protein
MFDLFTFFFEVTVPSSKTTLKKGGFIFLHGEY